MMNTTDSITLSSPSGCSRTVCTKDAIVKVKNRRDQKKRVSTRKLAKEMNSSTRGMWRIPHEDLGCKPYKKIIQAKLTNLQKNKTVKFANSVLNNYSNEDIKKCLSTDEKYFDPDGIYNSQNDRVWASSREETDRKGAFHQKTKHPGKVMVWLGTCAKSLTTPVIFENETMNAEVYISEVLPTALECDDKVLGSNWTYQQDSARPHIHNLTQE